MAKPSPSPRPSGYRNRQKAKARLSTHRAVRGLMNLANDGVWPAAPPLLWVTHEESPGLAAARAHLRGCFRRFQQWRKKGQPGTDVREVADDNDYLPSKEDEPNTWLEVHKARSFCHQLLGHLQEDDRWRNVRKCTTCRKWFYATRDPGPSGPYCGRKCWPSKRYIPSERPRTRVQSRKK